jgi:hypothetical protein
MVKPELTINTSESLLLQSSRYLEMSSGVVKRSFPVKQQDIWSVRIGSMIASEIVGYILGLCP